MAYSVKVKISTGDYYEDTEKAATRLKEIMDSLKEVHLDYLVDKAEITRVFE